jgi:hypothetical protein
MKRIFFLMITVIISLTGFAQLRIGPEAGMNLSQWKHQIPWSGIEKETSDFNAASKLGVFAHYRFTPLISVQSGLYFSQKGFKDLTYFPPNTLILEEWYTWSVNINYLELPINFFIHAGRHFYFGPGVYYAYAVGGKATIITQDLNEGTKTDSRQLEFGKTLDDNKVDFKRADFGLLVSAGYKINRSFFVQAQYSKGLRDMAPKVNGSSGEKETYYNSAFSLTAGWNLPFGGMSQSCCENHQACDKKEAAE